MDDLRERIKAAILDACYSYYEEIDFEKAADAVLAILREQEPIAWATHHDEPMFFPSEKEAWKYCDDDETPIPIYAAPMPPSVPEGCKWTLTEPTDEDLWESDCGAAWTFIDGGPTENGMRFCLGCGKPLEVVAPKPGDE